MKKGLIFMFLVSIFLVACGKDSNGYWSIEDSEINKLSEIQQYVAELQSERIDYRGYKIFNIAEGKKAVVISTGESFKKLRIAKMHQSSKDTAVTIAKTEDHSNYKNSYIVVGIEEIVGAFFVFERDELQEITD
ncbi:hypothetical protein [Pseudalkalibacillus berkeleyi]|uniref:Uncharacterized protein n=1 Tax=Pseudalkalibacillus berkeleyi TaxID=1069813 RepID=A0ABS9GZW0_9BACL|nr:hypothetical protein [Pseudalkalibacillus berkeleyi]MCF6138287.1 hypothetical protein [Pseudalkalibacillus berkeleyi]